VVGGDHYNSGHATARSPTPLGDWWSGDQTANSVTSTSPSCTKRFVLIGTPATATRATPPATCTAWTSPTFSVQTGWRSCSAGSVSGRFKGNHLYCRVGDIDAYVDLVRRLQTPYYEEARARFGEEDVANWLSDANEHYPYLPETLKRIADRSPGR